MQGWTAGCQAKLPSLGRCSSITLTSPILRAVLLRNPQVSRRIFAAGALTCVRVCVCARGCVRDLQSPLTCTDGGQRRVRSVTGPISVPAVHTSSCLLRACCPAWKNALRIQSFPTSYAWGSDASSSPKKEPDSQCVFLHNNKSTYVEGHGLTLWKRMLWGRRCLVC